MTTLLWKSQYFCATDSLWSCNFGKTLITCYPLRKYLKSSESGEITLFSGDELPILLTQALFSDVIRDDDYEEYLGYLSPAERLSMTSIDLLTGEIQQTDGSRLYTVGYDGSGGSYAAQFYLYAESEPYESSYGCNIEGAVRHAAYKDPGTDLPVLRKTWFTPYVDDLLDSDDNYIEYLQQRVTQLGMEANDMAGLRSTLKTSSDSNAPVVSVERAMANYRARKARIDARKAKQGYSLREQDKKQALV
ncbi:hypothetical protein ABMA57_15615 [Saccharospirillum sp. HFRX-1]|uniref:hypothetical protein n=1 Tax=unclassified Saccharospirillum TaxID=2633430 RepID=UPI003723F927